MRARSVVMLVVLGLAALVPAAGAVHVDSILLFEETYVWTGTETDREHFTVGNISTYPWVCYIRSYVPEGSWAWHASLKDHFGRRVVDDVGVQEGGVGVHVAVPLQSGFEGEWSFTMRGAGVLGDNHVRIYQVQDRADCAVH